MTVTLANSLQQMNEFADEVTYRMSGDVQLEGGRRFQVSTMQSGTDQPVPPPLLLANWWGDKFSRLFLNPVQVPKLQKVEVVVDLIPERQQSSIDSAWTPSTEVDAGSEIPVKVFLRPYRGERLERSLTVKIPADLPKGEHRILFSDANTLNRLQATAAAANR